MGIVRLSARGRDDTRQDIVAATGIGRTLSIIPQEGLCCVA